MKPFKIRSLNDMLLYKQYLRTELENEELNLQNHWEFAKKNVWSLTFQSALGQINQMKMGWGLAFGLVQNLVVDIKEKRVFKDGFSWSKLLNSSMTAIKNYFGVGVDDNETESEESNKTSNQ